MTTRRMLSALALVALLAACSDPEPTSFSGTGVVQEVMAADRQVVIEHEDIEGLMPAMTMNFDVLAGALPEGLRAGDRVQFILQRDSKQFRISSLRVLGEGEVVAARPRVADVAARADWAPDFELTDSTGSRVSLRNLRGKAVLLDFVFTTCPGPCPIQTGRQVDLQRALPPELAAQTWFVSISLDPKTDTPEAMAAYAAKRGADTAQWSFLTGDPEVVSDVIARYGIGTIREQDGNIDHMLVTFLIDPEGRIAERYMGLDHDVAELLAGLARVLD